MAVSMKYLSLAIAIAVATLPLASQAATIVKVADEFGTIQSGGARTATSGNRFWNIQGSGSGANASTGTLRFYMDGVKSSFDALYPQGWVVDNVTIVLEHDDSAFSAAGNVDVYHFTNDQLALTNGQNSGTDASPGNFAAAIGGTSPLRYDATTPITNTRHSSDPAGAGNNAANFGTLTKVDGYNFSAEGDADLDVLAGSTLGAVDTTGAIDASPAYSLNFPEAGPDSPLATLNLERVAAGSNLLLPALAADIMSGSDPVSMLFVAGGAGTVATYKGNPFGALAPPRMYISASAVPEPGTIALMLLGTVASCGLTSRRRQFRRQSI
jgi:hypothetical protein